MLAAAIRDGAVTPEQADLVSGIRLGLELAAAERDLVQCLGAV